MEKYKVEEIQSKDVWEKFVETYSPKTFLQSWHWGEVNKLCGAEIFRLGIRQEEKLVGVCLLIKENAKRGPHFVVPAGPLIDWSNQSLAKFFIKVVRELGRKHKAWFIRIRPELLDSETERANFKKMGFVYAPMHLHAENTWILDISRSEEELISGMRKTTRYLVRKSERSNLSLEVSKDPKLAKVLFDLQKETVKRHKFVGFGEDLFKTEIEVFGADEKASVFVCKSGKRSLAAAIIIFYGDTAYYHFSGSVSDQNKIPFSYFLQWQIIKEAKRRGIHYYNFWGIAPTNETNHRFAGVTLFKTGFGGQRVDWLHAHDLPLSPLYWSTYAFETFRKYLRRL